MIEQAPPPPRSIDLADPAARRSRISVISLLLGIAAVVGVGALSLQLRGVIDSQQSTNRSLSRAISDVESDLSRQIGATSGLSSISDRISDLENDLVSLDRSLKQMDQRVPSSLGFDLDALFFQVGSLRDCVNEYMRVVADAGGGRYWFYYC